MIEQDAFSQIKTMQRFFLPGENCFGHMYLKTVKHLQRLFSGQETGQLEISPSKKDSIHARKSHYRKVLFESMK